MSVDAVASALYDAYRTGPVAPIRDRLPSGDVDAAYAVQQANVARWVEDGRRVVGRKIGLTSFAVQRQLGVDQPDFGTLMADMAYTDSETIPLGRLLQPKAEVEVAFVLGADLDLDQPTVADVLSATAYLLPAIEVVDSRVAGWDIGIVDTVADNASSGVFVLGARPVDPSACDLRLAGMVLERNGAEVSTGAGAACLGHPAAAVVWLARVAQRLGAPLRAGDIVLSGALGPMVEVGAHDGFEGRIRGLGSVRCRFEAAA
jgi:2-keto-4-pentenoate hydratase